MNHLWQSSLFAGAIWLLTLVLRKNPARVRYWLWFVASVKFLIPFSVFVAAGGHMHLRTAAIPTQLPIIFEQIAEPLPGPPHITAAPVATFDPRPILAGIWACGFMTVAFRWGREWLRMRAILRRATPLHLDLPVPTMSSSALIEPGIFGIFRPVLLLPEGIADCLSVEEFRAILIHELCHVRRRDNLFASIHMATEALFWFHPLLWWIGHRMVEERERACDEEVLRQGSEPTAYAEGILKVCERYLESPLTCVAGVSGADLKKRIEGIMKNRIVEKLTGGKRLLLAGAGVLAVAAPIVVGIVNAPSLQAQQTAAATPKWEVASVRLCAGSPPGARPWVTTPGRLHVNCVSVYDLMVEAYAIYANGQAAPVSRDISGGPGWVKSDRYEIEAKADGTPSKLTMMGPMLQALLEDRFKLKIHRETKEIPLYALTVAKGGLKLKATGEGSCILPDEDGTSAPPFVPGPKPACGMFFAGTSSGSKVEANGVSLDFFARFLHDFLDRPVADKTEIAGTFNIHLEYTPGDEKPGPHGTGVMYAPGGDPNAAPPAAPPEPGPSIFTAFQEQLGLKLEPSKGPGEFIFIDRVARPEEDYAPAITSQMPERQQQSASRLEFEVASMRQSPESPGGVSVTMQGGPGTTDPENLTYRNVVLKRMLMSVYGVRDFQISGPGWIDTARYAISAKIPARATKEEFNLMLQHLIADRLKMTLHHETREFAAYSLTVAKGGPKLQASDPSVPEPPLPPGGLSSRNPRSVGKDGFVELPAGRSDMIISESYGHNRMSARKFPLSRLAAILESQIGRPVVDASGLDGAYDFTLDFSKEGLMGAMALSGPQPKPGPNDDPSDTAPSIFTAVQQQLGLKLEEKKVPFDVIVIDRVEKMPVEN